MFRKLTLAVFAVVLMLTPGQLFAGGPPWLCLPIDGVTADNAKDCARRLEKVLNWSRDASAVAMLQHKNQWYARGHFAKDVTLSQIEDALKGSQFRVPHGKLRLFGHATLEVSFCKQPPEGLIADLKAMKYVSVDKSKREPNVLLVTVDMPYPLLRDRQSINWVSFRRNDFSSDQSTRSDAAATRRDLPTYDSFREIIEKRGGQLKDVRWSVQYGCRPLGCVAYSHTKPASKTSAAPKK